MPFGKRRLHSMITTANGMYLNFFGKANKYRFRYLLVFSDILRRLQKSIRHMLC